MRIGALILAAGRSERFGTHNKLLADLGGIPVLARTVAAVAASGFAEIIVVTGSDHDAIDALLACYNVRIVRCDGERSGMGYSIAAGVSALSPNIEGCAVIPGDMPLLTASTLAVLGQTFVAHAGQSIVHAATRDGAQRNPVIWPRVSFPTLAALTGDRGAKAFIRDAIAVRMSDENELIDVDDAGTFEQAREIIRSRHAHS